MRKVITSLLIGVAFTSMAPCRAEWYDSDHSCMERAKTLYQSGKFDQSIEAISRALSINPDMAEAYYFRGILNHTLKRYGEALKDMNEAIRLAPEVAPYYVARGTLYSNQKKYEQAIQDFDEALKYEPTNKTAITTREFCLNQIERAKRKDLARPAEEERPLTVAASSGSSTSSYTPITSKKKKKDKHAPAVSGGTAGANTGSVSQEDIARRFEDEKRQLQLQLEERLAKERARERQEKEKLVKQVEELKKANAANSDGKPFQAVPDNRPLKDKWALIIGISKFQNPNLNLRYPSKDAQDFYNFLVNDGKFQKDHVKLLVDAEATRSNILSELGDKWLPRVANPDDLVVIYFSGHGSSSDLDVSGVNYLLAHDSDPEQLFASGLPLQDLTRIIKGRVHADRIVLILDACHSGAANPESKGLVRTKNVNVDDIVAGTGQLVISSSMPNQVSWESKEIPNSVFTRYLIEGLKSKGPDTTLEQAFDYMKERVQQTVLRERGVMQTPVLKSKWQGKDLSILAKPADPRAGL